MSSLDIISVCPLNQDVPLQVEHIQGSTGARHVAAALRKAFQVLWSAEMQRAAVTAHCLLLQHCNHCFDYHVMQRSQLVI